MVSQARWMILPLILMAIVGGVGVMQVSKAKVTRTHDWKEAEDKAFNTVVQVVAQHTTLNWLEPYKAPRQSEGYGTAFFIDAEGTLGGGDVRTRGMGPQGRSFERHGGTDSE